MRSSRSSSSKLVLFLAACAAACGDPSNSSRSAADPSTAWSSSADVDTEGSGNADGFDAAARALLAAGDLRWQRGFGGSTKTDRTYLKAVTVAQDGAAVMTGSFEGSVSFGGPTLTSTNGTPDIFVARVLGGTWKWSIRVGAEGIDRGAAVGVDPYGNAVVAGNFQGSVGFNPAAPTTNPLISVSNSDIFLAKYGSATGIFQWAKRIGGSTGEQTVNAMAVDRFGSIYMTGVFYGSVDFGNGASISSNAGGALFVAKYDLNGNLQWVRQSTPQTSGSAGNAVGTGVALDNASPPNVFVTGDFRGSIYLGGAALTASACTTSCESNDVFLLKLTNTNTHSWSKSFGGPADDYPAGIAVDGANNIYVAGASFVSADFDGAGPQASSPSNSAAGISDAYLVKYQNTGGFAWSKRLGGLSTGAGMEWATSVTADAAGNPTITGWFDGQTLFEPGASSCGSTNCLSPSGIADIFLVKYTAGSIGTAGTLMFAKRFGGTAANKASSEGVALGVDRSSNIMLAGSFDDQIDFGQGALTNPGGLNACLASFSP